MSDITTEAADYARMGWYVFPTGGPGNTTKDPHPAAGRWSETSSNDPDTVTAVFAGLPGPLGIGLDCGKSGLVAFDVDRPDEADWIIDAVDKAGGWFLHGNRERFTILCRQPGTIRCPPQAWGEVKGAGGYVVLPPSDHYGPDGPSGFPYAWIRQGDGDNGPGVTPDDVLDKLTAGKQAANEADNAEVAAFMDAHVGNANGAALDVIVHKLEEGARQRRPLHPLAQELLAWALEEAAVGTYPAAEADRRLGKAWLAGYVIQGRNPRPDWKSEWASIRRWTVGQVLDKTDAERAARAERVQLATTELTPEPGRVLVATPIGEIRTKTLKWVWDGRLTRGSFNLLAGGIGLGKSTLASEIAARISRGTLPGVWQGRPRGVLIVSPEEDKSAILVPRLILMGADVERVKILWAKTDELRSELELPTDVGRLEAMIRADDVGLVILDPLISRLAPGLDTNNDPQVRSALEPLALALEQTEAVGIGLIHENKSGADEPLDRIMGSRAFPGVARTTSWVINDPDEPGRRLFGIVNQNVGAATLTTKAFTIKPTPYDADDGDSESIGTLEWLPDVQAHLAALMVGTPSERGERSEVGDWVMGMLLADGGEISRKSLQDQARKEHYPTRTVDRVIAEMISSGLVERTRGTVPGPAGKPPIPNAVYRLKLN